MEEWVTELTFGNVVWNESDVDIDVTAVSLIDAHALSMIDAVLMPVPDRTGRLLGSSASYPPVSDHRGEAPDGWDERERAVGATVPAGHERQLVVGLRVVDSVAGERFPSIAGVRVEYESPDGDIRTFRSTYHVGVGCTGDDWEFSIVGSA